jgi:hypothetical protein
MNPLRGCREWGAAEEILFTDGICTT